MIETKTYKVEAHFVDVKGWISPKSLVDFLLTIAGEHADRKGFGIRKMFKSGTTWVLSRLTVEMEKYPQLGENIIIKTWVSGIETRKTTRKFLILDSQDNIIGNGSSVWVVLNLRTRRPMELSCLEGLTECVNDYQPIELVSDSKIVDFDPKETTTIEVRYSDVDFNQHTTTSRYIQWMIDEIPFSILKKKSPKRMAFNFTAETFGGDKLNLHKKRLNDDEYLFRIEKNGIVSCRAEISL